MSQSEKAKQVFATELAWIKSDEVRDFTLKVFDTFGMDYFWARPCSTSGKNHPKLAQGNGGLVRHVKYAAYWGHELCRAFGTGKADSVMEYHDCVISALLLHDLMKDGDPTLVGRPERMNHNGARYICACHGVDLANAILNRMLGGKTTTEQCLILYGIAGHMGIWTLPAEYQPLNLKGGLPQKIAQIVHLADYCASRKADDYLLSLTQQVPTA